jgi:hypothetical protein
MPGSWLTFEGTAHSITLSGLRIASGTVRPAMLTPTFTYLALLIVQVAHLLHHRLAKRHISFVEVVTAAVLCLPPFLISLPAVVFVSIHLILIAVQVLGSVWIRRLTPDWR